ncbi:MAG: tRNA pseudouridine(38-40) synthase TruA [Methanobrevibacter sp.]|jgi:tRNA pseudouridine38-40 synthase|nr:tRNA pseudouridine(38-40) synthase TruA [Candidatus Methanoflexus mossambicus]
MKNTLFKVAYIGTDFYGFQRQLNHRTVEGEIIKTLKSLKLIDNPKDAHFRIGGRTDKGVHSLGNTFSFMSEKEIYINQINDQLPDDIDIIARAPVRYGFKPRYAEMRHYKYFFNKNNNLNIDSQSIEKLEKLAKLFEGTYDFSNFTKKNPKTPVRTINKINLNFNNKNGDDNRVNDSVNDSVNDFVNDFNFNKFDNIFNNDLILTVDIYGESFLWNMVRKMMKVFKDVANGDMDLCDVEKLFNSENKVVIKPLDPENLILMDIKYHNIKFQYDDYAIEKFRRSLKEYMDDYQNKYNVTNTVLDLFNGLNFN